MRVYQDQPGTGDTLLYLSNKRFTHLTIFLANTTGADATITLNVAYQGASAAATNRILSGTLIPAHQTGLVEAGIVIEEGDTIRGLQGTADAITVTIDALNIEQDSHSRGSSMTVFPSGGTGSGGGLSSPLTTKGDIWGYDTTDDRIPVGSDGQLLKADSGASLGVSWATVSGITNYWTYDGSTLQPDPATTTPLDHFNVSTDNGFSVGADDGSNAYTVVGGGGVLAIATTGPSGNVTVNADGNTDIEAEGNATLGAVGNANLTSSASNVVIGATTGGVSIDATAGLVHIEGDHTSGVEIIASDVQIAMALDRIEMTGSSTRLLTTYVEINPASQLQIPVDAATTLGTVIGKIAIYNGSGAAGSLVGYLPIYDTIT